MSVARQSISFNSSVASSQYSRSEDVDASKVKSCIKDLLRSRIFLGRYLERRLTDQRIGYRDIVLVSPAEVDLKRDLLEAQQTLSSVCSNIHWIGITDAELFGDSSGVCLWTEIDNQPFGPFWFQIRSIKFREEEVIVTLKCIRYISESFLEIEPILTGTSKKTKITSINQPDSSAVPLSETYNEIVASLKSALSITNVKEFITFIIAFVIAIFTGSTALINFLGNFVLALIRELSIFVKNSTPMCLGFLDFLSKIVGGFYILLAMFFKPSNPQTTYNKRSITFDKYDRSSRHSSDYDARSFD